MYLKLLGLKIKSFTLALAEFGDDVLGILTGWSGVRLRAEVINFCGMQHVQPVLWSNQPSVCNGGLFFGGGRVGGDRPGSETDHSPSYGFAVKNEWSYTSNPLICLRSVYGDRHNFTIGVTKHNTDRSPTTSPQVM
jgi:hypothetical protein